MSEPLTRQGVRDLDALYGKRRDAPRFRCAITREHVWMPTGRTREDLAEDCGIAFPTGRQEYEVACNCGTTDWRSSP